MDIFYFIFQQTLYFTVPLLLVALGGMFSERSGVVNIALEGIMIMGAFVSILFVYFMQKAAPNMNGQILLLLALIIAGVAGGVFTLLHAFAAINLKADQVISGTALNLFAPAFAIFMAGSLIGRRQIQFDSHAFFIRNIPGLGNIPLIGPMFFQKAYLTTFIAVIILIITVVVMKKSRFGLRLKSCGEHPQAADSVGINVAKIRYTGVFLSGVLGGIGGLAFIIPTSTEFTADVAGYGFLALAVLIFGQWRPNKILLAALFFGFAKTIASTSSAIPFLDRLNIPSNIYKMIPFIATLIVLSFTSRSSKAPKAAGKPYEKGAR